MCSRCEGTGIIPAGTLDYYDIGCDCGCPNKCRDYYLDDEDVGLDPYCVVDEVLFSDNTCETCGGTGTDSDGDKPKVCPVCKGTGKKV